MKRLFKNVGLAVAFGGAGLLFFACDSEVNVTPASEAGADAQSEASADAPVAYQESGGGDGAVGGPVTGAADAHCKLPDGGQVVQATTAAACTAGGAGDGGLEEPYPPTMNNLEADDDECKYHVKWSSTPVQRNANVTFTVTSTKLTDASPVTGADPSLEIFLDETHPAPNTNVATTETSPGVYTIGPVQFDAPGKWTVRFHFFETCLDGEESPHGHAAFYVQVP